MSSSIDAPAGHVAVSVVVCTRNRSHYLPACLESLARQTCDVSYEVIVVDNASTDTTPRILHDWSLADARFRTTRETRLGLSVSKNTGVTLARGRLLLFTDDDVLVDPAWVRAYVDFFRSADDLVIAGGPIMPVAHDLRPWPGWFASRALPDLGLLDHGEERPLGRGEYVWGANMAIPARVFERVGPWNEALGCSGERRGTFEDTEYQDRVRAAAGSTWFCPGAKLQHRISRERIAPARLLRNAYGRGRNQFWAEVMSREPQEANRPRRDYIRCAGLLAGHLGAFAFWSLLLRLRVSQNSFVRAHAAAWHAGWAMDLLRVGRETSRLSGALARTALFVVDSVLTVVRGAERGGG